MLLHNTWGFSHIVDSSMGRSLAHGKKLFNMHLVLACIPRDVSLIKNMIYTCIRKHYLSLICNKCVSKYRTSPVLNKVRRFGYCYTCRCFLCPPTWQKEEKNSADWHRKISSMFIFLMIKQYMPPSILRSVLFSKNMSWGNEHAHDNLTKNWQTLWKSRQKL